MADEARNTAPVWNLDGADSPDGQDEPAPSVPAGEPRAFSYAPANLIAPLNYTQMIGSVVIGYLMFAEIPDVYTWVGSAVIIAAGLLVGWQSRKRT